MIIEICMMNLTYDDRIRVEIVHSMYRNIKNHVNLFCDKDYIW